METRINVDKSELTAERDYRLYSRKPNSVLYIDISHLSSRNQFVISCSAVFVLYLIYGFLQELLFTVGGFNNYGWYLTLVQFTFYTIFAFIECTWTKTKRMIPLKTYAFLALLTLGTMGFSNSSLHYLNYPTQVIFKCCKLIPVMIGSILIQNKKYKPIDFCAALCMCIGLSLFTLADSQLSPNFNSFGIFMISLALICDALIGNVQEKSMKFYSGSNREIILYSYGIGHLYLSVIMFATGSFWPGFHYCNLRPKMYFLSLLFSLTGYLGVQVVLNMVRLFGALTAVTVTTSRKAVSIVVSFIFFAKPYTSQYLWAGLIVVLGIYLNMLSKNDGFNFNYAALKMFFNNFRQGFGRNRIKTIETTV